MRPLAVLYLTRIALGVVAAIISTLLAMVRDELSFTTFMNCLTIALFIYLVSYYVLKAKFFNKVEKQSKIMTMGIGIYFFTWIVFLVLFYTILKAPM